MTPTSWSRCGAEDCVRLGGLSPGSAVQVRPGTGVAVDGRPAMAGTLVRDGGDTCFIPRFPFVDGTAYAVTVDGAVTTVLVRPRLDGPATTEVVDIHPTAAEVPRNLLRVYVRFAAPMSEGHASRQVRLLDDLGEEMAGALLPLEHELWDSGRLRLTVLLDPARIKRGLVVHRAIGYPLRTGAAFRVVVGEGFRDARGLPLRVPAERRFRVGGDERRRVEPDGWALTVPRSATSAPFQVHFDRPLDHGLLGRCLCVVGPHGVPLPGNGEVGPEERSWRWTPADPWAPERHQLVVDPILEDVAGNSVRRVFDRDLEGDEDDVRAGGPRVLEFAPG